MCGGGIGMTVSRVLWATVAIVGSLSQGTTHADTAAPTRTVQAFALPNASAEAMRSVARAKRIKSALARHLGARPIPQHVRTDLSTLARRARDLADNGAIPEAVATYDVVLQTLRQSPDHNPKPGLFADVAFARIALALAQDDAGVAEPLARLLLTYEPLVALSDDYASPRMTSLLARIRAEKVPRIQAQHLGASCHRADTVVTIRRVYGGYEAVRFDRCKRIASVEFATNSPDEPVLNALLGVTPSHGSPQSKPIYRRPWFWVAAVAVGSAAAATVWLSRRDSSPSGLVIEPKL